MAHCDDIAPLLSAFNDGELPAHETDLVTQHLDGCETCKETLIDYLLLGHHLRTATAIPSLDGFTEGVMRGIAGARRPFRGRLLNRLEDLRERWVAAVSLAGATVALATLALVLAEPHTWERISALFRTTAPPRLRRSPLRSPPRRPQPYPTHPRARPSSRGWRQDPLQWLCGVSRTPRPR